MLLEGEERPLRIGIVVHGGAGAPREWSDGCERAAEAGMKILAAGGSAMDAAMTATLALEDDGRFNAGSGAILRLDGKTIEMDAALMDSGGRLGIVAAIRDVKNPIRAARAVMDTPHCALAGEGATLYARRRGLAPHPGPTPQALKRCRQLLRKLQAREEGSLRSEWIDFDLQAAWNFPSPPSCDTVGAVALDASGLMASANSTGGASPMLLGRLGDTPFPGAGYMAGPAAAVAATGIGEHILRALLSRAVYDRVSHGDPVRRAASEALRLIAPEILAGLIAVTPRGWSAACIQDSMAWAALVE